MQESILALLESNSLKIRMIPLQIIYDAKGEEVYRYLGILSSSEINDFLIKYLNKVLYLLLFSISQRVLDTPLFVYFLTLKNLPHKTLYL